jgi:hypothetical protein
MDTSTNYYQLSGDLRSAKSLAQLYEISEPDLHSIRQLNQLLDGKIGF